MAYDIVFLIDTSAKGGVTSITFNNIKNYIVSMMKNIDTEIA